MTLVVMEATKIYSMPVYHALVEHGDFAQVLVMCRLHLDHISHLDAMIAALDAQIEAMMEPFRAARDLLRTIPGIAALAAAAVISEIGADVCEYFPDAAHLASWAGVCPGNHESAGKRRSGQRRHGNPHLQPVLVESSWAASATPATSRPSTTGTS